MVLPVLPVHGVLSAVVVCVLAAQTLCFLFKRAVLMPVQSSASKRKKTRGSNSNRNNHTIESNKNKNNKNNWNVGRC